jgi:peptidoglycan/xylan/chitin deacetylase (PgdA/CDA1 family)
LNARGRLVAALIVAAVLAYLSYRLLLRESNYQPAVVTPQMQVSALVGNSLAARLRRAYAQRVTYARRTDRPRLIALTFDDGPYPVFTPLLLTELRALHVPATFFLIGRDARQWPGLAQRIAAAGDEVCDHTQTHPDLDRESAPQVRAELLNGANSLYALTRDPSVRWCFRPPHGRYTAATLRTAQSIGYTTVLWTDDSGDWRSVTPRVLAQHLEAHATAPEIVLLHSGKLATVQMLPQVVPRFRAAGYRFVTVRTLLGVVSAVDLNYPARRSL